MSIAERKPLRFNTPVEVTEAWELQPRLNRLLGTNQLPDALRFSAMINLRRNAVCSLAYAEGVKINVIAIVHLSESCTTCSAGNRHHRAA